MSLRSVVRASRPALRASTRSAHTLALSAPRPALLSARPTMSNPAQRLKRVLEPLFSTSAAAPEAKAGDAFPSVPIRFGDNKSSIDFSTLPGKTLIVTVPGAFTPACNSQMPSYIENFDKFKAKGIDVYVVSVNDVFVVNAWKKNLIGDAATLNFAADHQAKLAAALGYSMDATAGLGGTRFKRSVTLVDNGKIVYTAVEPDSGKSTVTYAENVLKEI